MITGGSHCILEGMCYHGLSDCLQDIQIYEVNGTVAPGGTGINKAKIGHLLNAAAKVAPIKISIDQDNGVLVGPLDCNYFSSFSFSNAASRMSGGMWTTKTTTLLSTFPTFQPFPPFQPDTWPRTLCSSASTALL